MALIEKAKQEEKKHKRSGKGAAASKGPDEVGSAGGDAEGDQGDDGGQQQDAGPQSDVPENDVGQDQDGQSPADSDGGGGGQPADKEGGEQDDAQGGSPQGAAPQAGAPGEEGNPDQQTGQPGSPADDTGGGPAGGVDLSQVHMSAALKEEYQRANAALMTALYTNDNVGQAVIKGLLPQGPKKIVSVSRMAVLLFTQINKQLHLVQSAPQIVLIFVKDIVAHLLDLGQQVKQIQYSDQEATAALGAALEGVMRLYGVSKAHAQNMHKVVPRSQLADHFKQYQQHAASIKDAVAKNAQDWHHDHLAQPQAGGPGGPQGGAPQGGPQAGPGGPQGAPPQAGGPQQGGPPQQAGAPQGGGAGMISEAQEAEQSQGGQQPGQANEE